MKKKTFWDADSSPAGQKVQHFMDAELSSFLHNCLYTRDAQQVSVGKISGKVTWKPQF